MSGRHEHVLAQARERVLDAELRAAFGDAPDRGLREAIVRQLAVVREERSDAYAGGTDLGGTDPGEADPGEAVAVGSHGRRRALTTTMVALAAFVVVAIALFARWREDAAGRDGVAAHGEQDPRPPQQSQPPSPAVVSITDGDIVDDLANVRDPLPTAQAWSERAVWLADRAGCGVIATMPEGAAERPAKLGDVDARVSCARQALAQLATEAGVGLHVHGRNVCFYGSAASGLPHDVRVSLQAPAMSLTDFCKQLHARCGVSVVAPAGLAGTMRLDVHEAHWWALLTAVARALDLELVGCGSVFTLRSDNARAPAADSWMIQTNGHFAPVQDLLATYAQLEERNFVIEPTVVGTVLLNSRQAFASGLLGGMMAAVGAQAREEGRSVVRLTTPDAAVSDRAAGSSAGSSPGSSAGATADTATIAREAVACSDAAASLLRRMEAPGGDLDGLVAGGRGGTALVVFARRASRADLLRAIAACVGVSLRHDKSGRVVFRP
ncbi:MAG: hypothetical protein AB8H80_00855 [Planctomycetota bacterium]